MEQIERIYFVGAGGIGMAALERYYLAKGIPVAGYDRTPSELTEHLEKRAQGFFLKTTQRNRFRRSSAAGKGHLWFSPLPFLKITGCWDSSATTVLKLSNGRLF